MDLETGTMANPEQDLNQPPTEQGLKLFSFINYSQSSSGSLLQEISSGRSKLADMLVG